MTAGPFERSFHPAMRFLHCSDIHITADYLKLPLLKLGWRRWIALYKLTAGGRAADYADAPSVIRQIAKDFRQHVADHLILSGDLTAYALDSEFRGAREVLAELADDPRRCTIIPGNHDTYTPGSVHQFRFDKYFGHLLRSDLPEYQREGQYPFVRLFGEDVAVVGLLSARLPFIPGASYGRVGKAQLDGLRDLLHDPRMKDRVVLAVVHHAPLNRMGKDDMPHHKLLDTRKLFQLLRGPKHAVLHGHIHHRYHHPATETQPHLFGAGSSTQRGREGYWIIDVQDGRIMGAQMFRPGHVEILPGEQAEAPGPLRFGP